MSTINRYSGPTQVAKFDPMSAEEIMAIPLLKQEMEDEQTATARGALKELYNFQAVGPDQERVNAQRAALEEKLKAMADDIATTGISRQKTEALNKLKTEYDRATSLSGELGHANAFVAKRDAAKKNFYDTALKLGWPKDRADEQWQKHASKVSAFNKEGGFNTEYEELGLPQYSTRQDLLASKIKELGSIKLRDPQTGADIESNKSNLVAAVNQIMRNLMDPSTPEGRLAELEGWATADTLEETRQILLDQANIMAKHSVDYSAVDAANAASRKQSSADLLKELQYNSKAFTPNQTELTSLQDAGIKDTKVDRENSLKQLRVDIENAKKTGDLQKVEELESDYYTKVEIYSKLDDRFNNSPNGRVLQSNLNSIITDKNKKFFEILESGGTPRVGKDGKIEILSDPSLMDFDINGKKQTKLTNVLHTVSKDEYEKYLATKEAYDNGFTQYIQGHQKHAIGNEIVFVGSNKETKAAYEEVTQGVKNELARNSGGFRVEKISEFSDKGTLEPLEFNETDDKEANEKMVRTVMSNLSKDIQVLAFIPGSVIQPPGFRIRVDIPEAKEGEKSIYGELAGKTIEVNVSADFAAGGSIKDLMTTKFKAINREGEGIAQGVNEYYKYGSFVPDYSKKSDFRATYYNDNNIRSYFAPASAGTKLFGKSNEKLDIFLDPTTSQFKLRTKDKAGVTKHLTFKDIGKLIDLNTRGSYDAVRATSPLLIDFLTNHIKSMEVYRNAKNQTEMDDIFAEQLGKLLQSDVPIETERYQDLLNILS